jgi:hypothetical protein
MFGILLTFIAVIEQTRDLPVPGVAKQSLTAYYPVPIPLCPDQMEVLKEGIDYLNDYNYVCRQDTIKWQVFFNEFFCSFIFIFFFLVIRNYKVGESNSMVESFLKPIFVVIIF